MSPCSLASDWCKKELQHAEEHSKGIGLAKIYKGDESTSKELTSKYTYGDFTQDFDVGFRRLTAMMLGEPRSSWEYLVHLPDETLLEALKNGAIPGLIAKSFGEWVIVDKLWLYTDTWISEFERQTNIRIMRGSPRKLAGILRNWQPVAEQFRQFTRSEPFLIKQVGSDVISFENQLRNTRDDDHKQAGLIAFNIITNTQTVLETNESIDRNFPNLGAIRHHFIFDVAEKLRELIDMHARRSRYLY